jgi:DNA invertase Pin-like site-specific DNA recombinase
MIFTVLGSVSELERSLIGERVRAGLQHARQRGKRVGRPALRELQPREISKLRDERKQKRVPFRKLAEKYGISLWTAHRMCLTELNKNSVR